VTSAGGPRPVSSSDGPAAQPQRILIYGNSGSGKTTMARAVAVELGLEHLDLDLIAWEAAGERRSVDGSVALLQEFFAAHDGWVIEGCYGDLVEAALPWCTELRFLNPGVDACIANCCARPWEPEKYESREEQNRRLAFLLDWVRQYETRDDEYSLARHRAIFDGFTGAKLEYGSATG
jgi:adenylate kinase family enzyme